MKRDVKVGLFVAAIVCCVAALLLGGGMVGRSSVPAVPLRVDVGERRAAALPAELAGALAPPADAESLAELVELPGDPAEGAAALVEAAGEVGLPEEDPLEAIEALIRQTSGAASPAGVGVERADRRLAQPEAVEERPAGLLESGPSASGPVDMAISEMDEDALIGIELAEAEAILEGPARPLASASADVSRDVSDLLAGLTREQLAPPPPAKYVYKMKQGDSYWRAARRIYGAGRYYVNIHRANPDVEPRKLRPGDMIAIPEIEGVRMRKDLLADPAELEASRRPRVYLAEDRIHEVQPLETLEDIALKYYGYRHKWPHILKANRDVDPRRIRPGDTIKVPALIE